MPLDQARLPYRAAIEAALDKDVVTRAKFDRLMDDAKARAFTVANVGRLRVLTDIYEAHLDALRDGLSLHDFRERLPEMAERRGWTGNKPWHAQLVFRQNGNQAYMAGRFAQMAEAGVGHWRYADFGDGRVRPTHHALNGKVFSNDDRTFYPPIDYNCRCIAEPIFDQEIDDGTETVLESADVEGSIEWVNGEPVEIRTAERYSFDPLAFGEDVNLEGVPGFLREAFEKVNR